MTQLVNRLKEMYHEDGPFLWFLGAASVAMVAVGYAFIWLMRVG